MVGALLVALAGAQEQTDPEILSRLFLRLKRGEAYEAVLRKVQKALVEGADPTARRGEALCLFAARDNRGKIVEAILKAGGNPNVGGRSRLSYLPGSPPPTASWTYPLHVAAGARQPQNVRVLLKFGAKERVYGSGFFEDRADRPGTPLATVAQLPLPSGFGSRRLSDDLAEQRDIEIAGLLLKAGADIHWSRPDEKMTPLHWAAMAGKPKLAAFLTRNGADKKRLTTYKWTPHDVARNNHPKNKELLRVLDFPGRKPGPPLPRSPVADL